MFQKNNNRANLAIQSIMNILENNGLDPALCLKDTGIIPHQVMDIDTDISDFLEIKIIEQALAALPAKAGYGIESGQSLHINNCGVWGLAILTSPDVRSAFETASRYSEMSIMLSKVNLEEMNDRVTFRLNVSHLPVSIHRFIFERYYATTLNFLQEMVPGYDFSDYRLLLPFSDPDYEQALSQLTQLTVIPDSPCYGIRASKELLDFPFPQSDSIIHQHFIAECEQVLRVHKQLPDHSQKIRDYILTNKAFFPRLSDVASSLFMSERTLKRRLQEEGHNFSEIVLDTKMALAKELLLTASLPVKVVAARLDYSEPASFIRAFGKWWGVSPSEIKPTQVPLRYLKNSV